MFEGGDDCWSKAGGAGGAAWAICWGSCGSSSFSRTPLIRAARRPDGSALEGAGARSGGWRDVEIFSGSS